MSKWQLLTSTDLRRLQVTLSQTKGNIVVANNINDLANENGYFTSANTQIPLTFGDDIKHLNLSLNYKNTSKYKAYLSFMKEELDVDIDESKIDLFYIFK